jgi:hypothetical protein
MRCFGRPHPKTKFTDAEDAALTNLVRDLGTSDWQEIADHLPGRNPRQCRDRWVYYLSPEVGNGPWTVEEETLLLAKHNELGSSWKRIAPFFPGRTDINVKSRFLLIQRRLRKKATRRCLVTPMIATGIRTDPLPFYIPPPPPGNAAFVRPPADQPNSRPDTPGLTDGIDTTDMWTSLMMNADSGLDFSIDAWF